MPVPADLTPEALDHLREDVFARMSPENRASAIRGLKMMAEVYADHPEITRILKLAQKWQAELAEPQGSA